jgi:hypothetical protein
MTGECGLTKEDFFIPPRELLKGYSLINCNGTPFNTILAIIA